MQTLQVPAASAQADLVTTDPPCRCRNPFGDLPGEREEILLDTRDLPMEGQIGRTLLIADSLSSRQRLRQVSQGISWPLAAMLEMRGFRYRIVRAGTDGAELLVWRNQ